MGKPVYGEKFSTAALGKPFIRIRTVHDVVYGETGDYSREGNILLYMDPRGETEFAIGLHDWMYRLLATKSKWEMRRSTKLREDSHGHKYILGPTAKVVLEEFASAQRQWDVCRKAVESRPVICVSFRGSGPKFDSDGNDITDAMVEDYEGLRVYDHDIEISLRVERGVYVDEGESPGFYRINQDGGLESVHVGYSHHVFIDDTEENRAKIQAIRQSMVEGMDKLVEFFSQPQDKWLASIVNLGTLRLPHRTSKRIARRRL